MTEGQDVKLVLQLTMLQDIARNDAALTATSRAIMQTHIQQATNYMGSLSPKKLEQVVDASWDDVKAMGGE